jgi:hypothetical protein
MASSNGSEGETSRFIASARKFSIWETLVDATRAQNRCRPHAFVQGLLSAVREFSDTAAAVDDATIVVLSYR